MSGSLSLVDMSRLCFLSIAALLTCAHAYEDKAVAPEVVVSEGGTAILHCLLHLSNPPPKITWKYRSGKNVRKEGRYRSMPDDALEINPVYRSDAGVYICVADNVFASVTQKIHLIVNDLVQEQDCSQFRAVCKQTCQYGIDTSMQNVCHRCKCREDPCLRINCSAREHCETIELSSPTSQGDTYAARCVKRGGCKRLKKKCNKLINNCKFGIQRITDTDGCERCKCKRDPCRKTSCAGKRCVVQKSKPSETSTDQTGAADSLTYIAVCETVVKAGACPADPAETSSHKEICNRECKDDANCDGLRKCCRRGCSDVCLLPIEQTSPNPVLTTASVAGREGVGYTGRPCSTSAYGCCQDDKTPAHGPDLEGCCLLQAFGCCPDNRKSAEGPNGEGCGCQYTLHGCCPDNVTIAPRPGNQGCGCQYTKHGCCPDRHTAASGPKNEGCTCNTYQFGCCADGVTTATGPEQQGCHCRETKFGCCGDGETPATGPDGAGCDCSSSRHGCCSDGRTEATGPKFLGCTNAPENKQAACSMWMDPGPCHNFTTMWYYDLTYERCSRFWYGGCDGNGNKFATKQECEHVCVQPSPKGQCNLQFDQGSCAGNYSRWGFNSETYRCEQFIWGGCEGNTNRFSYKADCQMRCAQHNQPPQCTLSREPGNCTTREALWSFSQSENRCVPFYYSGCGGNDNRFTSRETCEQTCPSAYVPDKCTLPAEIGQCSNYRQRWFYDTTFKRCRQFYYGGCGGNENNFGTEAECNNSCSELKTTTTTTTTTTTASPDELQPEEYCFNAIDVGPCNNIKTRYAYDSELGRCVTFLYGGCGGNQNNFPDEDYCSYYCQPKQDTCALPMLQGPCDESLMLWFYDYTTDSCSQFTYGGCDGNDNRFESFEACEYRCRTGPAPVAPTTTTTAVIVDGASECIVPEALEDCRYGGVVWFFDTSRHECMSHVNTEAGPACRYTGTYSSLEACERSCGASRGVETSTAGGLTEMTENISGASEVETSTPSTTNEGTADVIGTTMLDPCSSFEFGCCADNETEASGPDGQGCPCNATEFGCFPNGVSPEPVRMPAGIDGRENDWVIGELSHPFQVCCPAYGYPPPSVEWYRSNERNTLLYNDTVYEPRGNVLRIRNLKIDSLGTYTCEANNGVGQPAAWKVVVRAYKPEGLFIVHEFLVPRGTVAPSLGTQCQTTAETTTTTTSTTLRATEVPRLLVTETLTAGGLTETTEYTSRALEFETSTKAGKNMEAASATPITSTPRSSVRSKECDYDEYVANCSRLSCEYGVQHTRSPDGCGKCSCVQVEIDCEPLRQECNQLKCNYEVERIVDADGCERCECIEYPCKWRSCGAGERCVVQQYVNHLKTVTKFAAECRTIVKAGACPVDKTTTNEVTCRSVRECGDDADCRGVGKCCRQGCSYLCLTPVEQKSPHPLLTTTVAPKLMVPAKCTDNPVFSNCNLAVRRKFCKHPFYSKFCCKSCVEAGQLDPQDVELQADQPYRKT